MQPRVVGALALALVSAAWSCMSAEPSGPVLELEASIDALAEQAADTRAVCEETQASLLRHRKLVEAPEVMERVRPAWDPDGPLPKIGVPECDEYVRIYSRCIAEKMPEAAKESCYLALRTSIDAWRKAAVFPAGREGLPVACETAYEAVKASCGW